jgi:hypothetical protein
MVKPFLMMAFREKAQRSKKGSWIEPSDPEAADKAKERALNSKLHC